MSGRYIQIGSSGRYMVALLAELKVARVMRLQVLRLEEALVCAARIERGLLTKVKQ